MPAAGQIAPREAASRQRPGYAELSIRCNGIGRKPQAWRVLAQPGLHVVFPRMCLGEIACGAVLIGLACALHSMFVMIVAEMAVIDAFALTA